MLNRRKFIIGTGAIGAALLLDGCAPTAHVSDKAPPVLSPEVLKNNDSTSTYLGYETPQALAAIKQMEDLGVRPVESNNGIINAGLLGFSGGGWGALFKEQGIIAIVTLPHVVEEAGYMEEFTIHIPGVGFIKVERPNWQHFSQIDFNMRRNGDRDFSHMYCPLGPGDALGPLERAIEQGRISPVRPIYNVPTRGENVGVLLDNFGKEGPSEKFGFLRTGRKNNESGLIVAKYYDPNHDHDRLCDLGGARTVFRVRQGRGGNFHVTGQVWGSIKGGLTNHSGGCSSTVVVKPFFPLSDIT